jgi:glycosyltransferase involved in cell wall biosynthesis
MKNQVSNKKIGVLLALDRFPPDYTGAGLRAMRLAERINKKYGYRFKVLCTNQRKNGNHVAINNNMGVKRLNSIKDGGIFFPVFLIYNFIRANIYLVKNKDNIDIIHFFSFSWMSRLIMLANTMFYKKKTMLEVTLDGVDDPKSLVSRTKKDILFRFFTLFLLKRIDLFIVPSKEILKICISQGIKRENLLVMPRPVDELEFASIPFGIQDKLRKKLDLPNKFILLNVGMIYPRKNQLFLVKCLEVIPKKDIVLVLIGPPYKNDLLYYNELKQYIVSHGLKDKVLILGEKPNVNEYAIAADLFVFSSTSEGSPNVIMESVMSGLPFISFSLDSINEFIDPQIGMAVNRDGKSEEELKKEFTTLIEMVYSKKNCFDRSKIREFGKNHFSSEKIDKKYVGCYTKILGRKNH